MPYTSVATADTTSSAAGLVLQTPILITLNVASLVLSIAAILALFRFKVGMIRTLIGCSLAGIAIYVAGGIDRTNDDRRNGLSSSGPARMSAGLDARKTRRTNERGFRRRAEIFPP